MCLLVTCHLHFWQNGRDLLRATAVTRAWNGYRNKCQHRQLTLETLGVAGCGVWGLRGAGVGEEEVED